MRLIHIPFIMIIMIVTLFSELSAQSALDDSDFFFYGQNADEDLHVLLPENSFSKKGIQYGAILSPVYLYENKNNGELGAYIVNTKIWAKTYLWKDSFLYVRGRDSYIGIQKQEGIYSGVKSDNVLDLDLAFLSMSSGTGNLNLTIGRKIYTVGSGLVLDGRGDGAEASWNGYGFSLDLIGLYTGLLLKDSNPYGLSDRDLSDGAERAFAGAVASVDFLNQKFYIFGVAQADLSKENSSAKTEYNSEYFGTGLEGILFENLSYSAEFVYETGKSYVDVSNTESSISAYAVNSGIDYFIPVIFNPAISLQYAFGSGDKYRTNYTDSIRPEGSEGKDNGFISFGTFSGGYGFKPVLSNLHVMRAGLSIAPFSWADSASLKKMSLGSKYSYYMKDKQESAVKSGEGSNHKSFVGQGVDVTLRWQIFYDLSLYVNYGLFLPGKAYEDKGAENFGMAGVNVSI